MIRVAIVGFGFMGRMHYGVWRRRRDSRVVAVCDVHAAQFTAKVSGNRPGADNSKLPRRIRLYSDLTEMLSVGGFDVVDITLPTFLHPDAVISALNAGFHVLCEKPMALDLKECDRMLAAEAQSGKILMIAQCARYDPPNVYLKRLVEEQTYGAVLAADFTRFCAPPAWTSCGKGWFANEKVSGGVVLDMHIHDADLVQHLFGLPKTVSSVCHRRPDGAIDHVSTAYGFADKVVTADASWAASATLSFDKSYRVFFENATVFCGARYGKHVVVYPNKGKPFEVKLGKVTGYDNEIAEFATSVRGKCEGVPPPARDAQIRLACSN